MRTSPEAQNLKKKGLGNVSREERRVGSGAENLSRGHCLDLLATSFCLGEVDGGWRTPAQAQARTDTG